MLTRLLRYLGYVQALELEREKTDNDKLVKVVSDCAEEVTEKSELIRELQTSLNQCRIDIAGLRVSLAKAESDTEYWRKKTEAWEAKFEAATAEITRSTQIVADWVSMLRFGRTIYGVAPPLPEKRPDEFAPVPKIRQQARAVVQAQEKKFNDDVLAFQKSQWAAHLKNYAAQNEVATESPVVPVMQQ